MKKYFLYDPEGCGFELYESEEKRDADAEEAIRMYLDDGWGEDVDRVCTGIVTHTATEVEVKNRPPEEELDENGCDEDGTYWDSDWHTICDYKLIAPEKEVSDEQSM